MNFKLEIWRQFESGEDGAFEKFEVTGIDPEASFLEMLDQLNERLGQEKKRSIAFDSDCREGICGSCSLVIDGHPHGPRQVTDLYLLALAVRREGRFVTFDRSVALDAIHGAQARHLFLL